MERSYSIQSPKFFWVWSQSHQRIANNWIRPGQSFIADRCARNRRVQILRVYVRGFGGKSQSGGKSLISASIYGIVERLCFFIPFRMGCQKLLQVGSAKYPFGFSMI